MRNYGVFGLLVSLVLAPIASVSVIGQEEPLPAVVPKAVPAIAAELPPVVLAVEPIRDFHTPTLAEAARSNDYVTFDALYRQSKERGEAVAAYDTLHELWSWSVSDPIGAFYGADIHERLAAVYPDFTKFIDEHRIIDDRGNVFYPTSETRAFLAEKARLGDGGERRAERRLQPAPAPPVAVAEAAPAPAEVVETPAPAPAPARQPAPEPAVVAEVQPQAAPVPQPVVQSVPTAVLQPAAPLAAPPAAVPPAPADSILATRGLLLLIIGLIGIGVLAVMLRTPGETPQVTILKPDAPEKPVAPAAPVEPLRRPAAPAAEEPRATGSHG